MAQGHLTLNQETATNLVIQATTQEQIKYALDVFQHPQIHGYGSHVELSQYQREMYIEQLQQNACSLDVHGVIK